MIIIILSLIDPDPVTRLNEIPGAAKLGKIYHFVWSVGTLDSETWDQQRKSPYFTNHGIIRCDDEQLKIG